MNKSLKGRFVKGLGGQAMTQSVNILMQLATVPLLLYFWGVDLLGEWLVLTAIPTYLTLSELGFISATINAMTMEVARHDRPRALVTFQSSVLMLGGMSLVMIVIGGLFAWLAPMADWFSFIHLTNAEAGTVIALQIAAIVVGLQAGLINAGFICEGAYGLGTVLMSATDFAGFALAMTAAAIGLGPVGAAAMLVVAECGGLVVMAFLLRRRIAPWLHHGVAHASLRRIRELFKPALGFVVYAFGQALNIQGILLVVGAVLGPATVTAYSAMRMMTRLVNTLLNAYYGTVRPEIAMAYGKGDTALIRRLHEGACQVAIWLALVAAVGFSVLGAWFLDLWTHGNVALDPWLFAGLIAGMLLYALWFASSMVFYATSRHHGMAFALLVTNGASVVLAFGLMKLIGLPGAGIAAAAGEFVMLVFVLRRTLIVIDEPFADWARAVARPPIRLLRELIRRDG